MSNNNTRIRPLRPEDIEPVVTLALKAWEAIHDGYREAIGDEALYGRLHDTWRERKAAQIRKKALQEPEQVPVTEQDGRVIGFTTFSLDAGRKVGTLCNNAVDPSFQGQGIGSQQHEAVLECMRAAGMKVALVGTGYDDRGHARARASYEKAGFRRISASATYARYL